MREDAWAKARLSTASENQRRLTQLFQWDGGTLNFIIHCTDFAAQHFDRVLMICDYW
ncbi:DUF1963 domain-containing protein [Pectobacterium sp. A5351]|uniref:DUF1963 domain-containing protein n=1 Tax=Pectobacterium sp. A5351 TaxID=2914983 RepID=UPI003FA6D47C